MLSDELPASGWSAYRLHQRLIGVRRRNAWLVRARTKVEHLTNQAIALRSTGEGGELLLLLNVADECFPVTPRSQRAGHASSPLPGWA